MPVTITPCNTSVDVSSLHGFSCLVRSGGPKTPIEETKSPNHDSVKLEVDTFTVIRVFSSCLTKTVRSGTSTVSLE